MPPLVDGTDYAGQFELYYDCGYGMSLTLQHERLS